MTSPRKFVWSVAPGGAIRLGIFAHADTKSVSNAKGLALLVQYFRSQKHRERVLTGESEIASIQIVLTAQQARRMAVMLTKAADNMVPK